MYFSPRGEKYQKARSRGHPLKNPVLIGKNPMIFTELNRKNAAKPRNLAKSNLRFLQKRSDCPKARLCPNRAKKAKRASRDDVRDGALDVPPAIQCKKPKK